jgi:hypothetical protein
MLDQADLKGALAKDQATSRALKQADDVARTGRATEAIDLLKRTAEPAADEALTAVTALTPRTTWGRTEKGALVALTTDRKTEMARYENALSGGSDEDKLAALTKQVDIETRAAALMEEIDRGP